jgi:hypothetical protein
MALSNAEKQQRFRDKRRAARAANLKKPETGVTTKLFQKPFFERMQGHPELSEFEFYFDYLGIDPPEFVDDSGPKSKLGIMEHAYAHRSSDDEEPPYGDATDSLGRAEVAVGSLISAAVTLAGIINRYKREELLQREKEITAAMIDNPYDAPRLADTLIKIRTASAALEKNERWTLPVWKVESSG